MMNHNENLDNKEILEQKETEIRRENKKALPSFLIFLAVAAVVGFCIGLLMGILQGIGMDAVKAALDAFWARSVLWIIPIFAVLLLLPSFLLAVGQKKAIAALAEDDEEGIRRIDERLSVAMLMNGSFTLFLLFGLAVMLAVVDRVPGGVIFGALAELIAGLALMVFAQQRLVDLTKRLYPEKHGSVYDTKFNKVWIESCDERERSIIYQSAYTAYKTAGIVYPVLFLVVAVGAIPFGYGPLPAGIVLVCCLVQLLSYCTAAMKLEKSQKGGTK